MCYMVTSYTPSGMRKMTRATTPKVTREVLADRASFGPCTRALRDETNKLVLRCL